MDMGSFITLFFKFFCSLFVEGEVPPFCVCRAPVPTSTPETRSKGKYGPSLDKSPPRLRRPRGGGRPNKQCKTRHDKGVTTVVGTRGKTRVLREKKGLVLRSVRMGTETGADGPRSVRLKTAVEGKVLPL